MLIMLSFLSSSIFLLIFLISSSCNLLLNLNAMSSSSFSFITIFSFELLFKVSSTCFTSHCIAISKIFSSRSTLSPFIFFNIFRMLSSLDMYVMRPFAMSFDVAFVSNMLMCFSSIDIKSSVLSYKIFALSFKIILHSSYKD